MGEGNAKRANVAWTSLSTLPPSIWSGDDASVCGNAKAKDEEGDEKDARGQMSTSPRGGRGVVVGGGMGSVQDQLVENGVCEVVVGGGGDAAAAAADADIVGVSHSNSAW